MIVFVRVKKTFAENVTMDDKSQGRKEGCRLLSEYRNNYGTSTSLCRMRVNGVGFSLSEFHHSALI